MNLNKNLALTLIASLSMVSCGAPKDAGSLKSQTQKTTYILNSKIVNSTLTVTDQAGNAIADAKVLIGSAVDTPFSGNYLITDASGSLAIPAGWTSAQPVTIDAPGFVRTTFMNQTPIAQNYQLRAAPGTAKLEVDGTATDFGNIQGGDTADVALVMPMLTHGQYLNFQLNSILSPENDVLDVMGRQVMVPSNLAVPNQSLNYSFFNITLNKPGYRQFFTDSGTHKMTATHCQFPVTDVVDAIRAKKSFFEILNFFDFVGGSVRTAQITASRTNLDIPVGEMSFSPSIPIQAPMFDSKYGMVAISLVDDGGTFFPADLKRVMSKAQATLKFPTQSSASGEVLSVLKQTANVTVGAIADEMSSVMLPSNQSNAIEFLPIVKSPSVSGNTLNMSPPTSANIKPVATYAVLSDVQAANSNSSVQLEHKQPRWDIYADNWTTAMALPQFPDAAPAPVGKLRWEVLFLGNQSALIKAQLGAPLLEKVSHVTRSAVNL